MLLYWSSSHLHQLLQRHEVSQCHLLAGEEGLVPQELVFQLLQCPVYGGLIALHLLLGHLNPNERCQYLTGAKDRFSLWPLPPPRSLTVNHSPDGSPHPDPQRYTRDATDVVSMPAQVLLMDTCAGLQVSWVPVVRRLVLRAQVNQDSHTRDRGRISGCEDLDHGFYTPAGSWGFSAFDGPAPWALPPLSLLTVASQISFLLCLGH